MIWGNRCRLQQFDCSISPVRRCLIFTLAVELVLQSVVACCCNAIRLNGSAGSVARAGSDARLAFEFCDVCDVCVAA